jgi:CelD/BcsL family acetyltransferase involved in cellulose biosynthesis
MVPVSGLRLRQLDSVGQLRARAEAWDDLWRRSEVTIPTARAELVALWLEHLAPRAVFRGLVVEQGNRLVAAIPLVGRRVKGLFTAGDVTWNYWSPNGDLLLDPADDGSAALDLLAAAVEDLPWPLLWLEMPPVDTSRWQALLEACAHRALETEVHRRYEIGTVEIAGDFQQYEARLSKGLRRNVAKELRRLERAGPVKLKTYSRLAADEVEHHLRRALQIEDRGWKGDVRGSVLGTPGIAEFYACQIRKLAEWGGLRVSFLEHRGEPIAFELGWTGKEVYHSFKVGYDPAYAPYSPGNLLRFQLTRALYEEPGHRMVDFQGPLTGALRSWSTGSYSIGRVVVAPRRLGSRALLAGYRALGPVVRSVREWTARSGP